MTPLKEKVIQVCTFEKLEELITCPYYRYRSSPFKCIWKALSDECLNNVAKSYWNKKDEKVVQTLVHTNNNHLHGDRCT